MITQELANKDYNWKSTVQVGTRDGIGDVEDTIRWNGFDKNIRGL